MKKWLSRLHTGKKVTNRSLSIHFGGNAGMLWNLLAR